MLNTTLPFCRWTVNHSCWNLRSHGSISLYQPFAHTKLFTFLCPNVCVLMELTAWELSPLSLPSFNPNIDHFIQYNVIFLGILLHKFVLKKLNLCDNGKPLSQPDHLLRPYIGIQKRALQHLSLVPSSPQRGRAWYIFITCVTSMVDMSRHDLIASGHIQKPPRCMQLMIKPIIHGGYDDTKTTDYSSQGRLVSWAVWPSRFFLPSPSIIP